MRDAASSSSMLESRRPRHRRSWIARRHHDARMDAAARGGATRAELASPGRRHDDRGRQLRQGDPPAAARGRAELGPSGRPLVHPSLGPPPRLRLPQRRGHRRARPRAHCVGARSPFPGAARPTAGGDRRDGDRRPGGPAPSSGVDRCSLPLVRRPLEVGERGQGVRPPDGGAVLAVRARAIALRRARRCVAPARWSGAPRRRQHGEQTPMARCEPVSAWRPGSAGRSALRARPMLPRWWCVDAR